MSKIVNPGKQGTVMVIMSEKQLYLLGFITEREIGREMDFPIHERNRGRMIDLVELSHNIEEIAIPV